ncbi:protein Jade-1-like [Dreissena polymorpha]|nr:protein Jade-1-like [Dreissena polymorpha]
MAPSKNKRASEESPERRSKRRRPNEDEEEEEKEREPVSSKASSSKKAAAYSSSGGGGGGGGGGSHKPAELFRKDLISAMKLPDSEPLAPEDYLLIADQWKQEWERGVQVPVNEVAILPVVMREVTEKTGGSGDFKMPKKCLHAVKDETYQLGMHELTGMSQLSEQVVRYDLDDLDVAWLIQLNETRVEVGAVQVLEWTMERVLELFEARCHDKMETKKKTEEGLGIEYDEDIVCEICQSPESEDTNEMVFCDGCDICVHQACYGIQTVPEGSWLCRTCALGIKPACILCPKVGGAMKSTRSGSKWAHVSCAIWIPEVTIGCVDKMEPITKISMIPASRWALICCVCKERAGACIQCSVKSCKTAFHVTCAISDKLEMKTVLVEEKNTADDVKLKAYCPKHSRKKDRRSSESDPDSPRKSLNGSPVKESHMTEEERATLRARRLQRLEDEFFSLIDVADIAQQLDLPEDVVDLIFVYWKLKRRSMFNRPLLTPKTEEADLLEKQQEDSLVARMKMFVHLRQDLERVRNLTYMISRREKMKKQFNSARESVFYATLEVLTDKNLNLSKREVDRIVQSYKDLPPPYGNSVLKKHKITPTNSRAPSVASRRSSVDSTSGKRHSVDLSGNDVTNNQTKTENQQSRRGRPKGRVSSIIQEDNKSSLNTIGTSDDKGNESDDSVDNTPQTSEVHTRIVQSDMETSDMKLETLEGKNEGRRSVGRPKKINKEEVIEKVEEEKAKPSGKRGRPRTSLPEIVEKETESCANTSESVERTSGNSVSAERRERRHSVVAKLSETEKEELVEKYPSAKLVSDQVKAELSGYLTNNKLVVSNSIRHKVQTALLNGKHRNKFGKGIIIDHTQSKIDNFFVKSPPQCDPTSLNSPVKSVSRVLNELSPTRDRLEANNVERTTILRSGVKVTDCHISTRSGNTPGRNSPAMSEKSEKSDSQFSPTIRTRRHLDSMGANSVKDKRFDNDSNYTRSSASTPESSVSGKSNTRKSETRLRTRSATPVAKDSDSETENMYSESKLTR